jgi:hypothetical protein
MDKYANIAPRRHAQSGLALSPPCAVKLCTTEILFHNRAKVHGFNHLNRIKQGLNSVRHNPPSAGYAIRRCPVDLVRTVKRRLDIGHDVRAANAI